MDTRNADVSAWIVKVPHALATIWKVACEHSMSGHVDDTAEVVSLGRIVTEEAGVSFLELPDNMIAEGIPRRFKLQQMPLPAGDTGTKLHVLSYEVAGGGGPAAAGGAAAAAVGQAAAAREITKARVEGAVAQRMDMLPMVKDEQGSWVMDPEYAKLIRSRTERAAERTRVVGTYEDLSVTNRMADLLQHKQVVTAINAKRKANEAAAKADAAKRPKLEKEELEGLLFKLFERLSAWTFKALVGETRQPQAHLKAVLEGIAVQQKRGPNKDKYELKPEYRRSNKAA